MTIKHRLRLPPLASEKRNAKIRRKKSRCLILNESLGVVLYRTVASLISRIDSK